VERLEHPRHGPEPGVGRARPVRLIVAAAVRVFLYENRVVTRRFACGSATVVPRTQKELRRSPYPERIHADVEVAEGQAREQLSPLLVRGGVVLSNLEQLRFDDVQGESVFRHHAW